ncbi:protoporphyrinogen oxidase [Actinokineospora auranticolor]|uniref:Coproporphyrinogen III oxidase n=1 Tax=Actinokineospora auranticolor TaxID=155976 RepID=A0A2S6GHQ2_9PSEU|nr:protoporphyrinogen oxidase [Actinokineospora auranticolor]PPK64676.1 oxygen-dependent protoporphyrinogen oxidase [Actinokineospora auranticolor]
MTPPRVAVVGGGISGLTAAHRLRVLLGADARITVVEQTDRLGGKIRTAEVAGRRYDVGAEAYLVRRPEVTALLDELGITGVAHPTAARSTVRAGGVTRPIPGGTVMGVPADPAAVKDLLSDAGLRRVAAEAALPPVDLDGDAPLGALLRDRFGDELPDRLVDPLLGGVYAGGVDGLGLRATLPAIAGALDAGARTLTEAAAKALPKPTSRPVFGTLAGGLSALVDRLAGSADVRLGTTVRALARTEHGWRLTLGANAPAHAPADPVLDVDAVVLAVPAPAARKLLADVAPVAAAAYGRVEVASMAVVALALPEGTELPGTSGVLLGARERRLDGTPFAVKAFTFSASKWAHLGGETVVVRGSVGRHRDPGALRADDDELVRLVRADLVELTGVTAPPVDALVTRWGGGLPQYAAGHADLVDEIERAVDALPGLAVAGATLHGVGIPACIGTGEAAARRVAAHVRAPATG